MIILDTNVISEAMAVSPAEQIVDRIFTVRFSDRVLPFDSAAARELPAILIEMRRDLRSHSRMDAFIAAIARAHSATVATRNVHDFEKSGVPLVNPWNE